MDEGIDRHLGIDGPDTGIGVTGHQGALEKAYTRVVARVGPQVLTFATD